MQIYIAKPGGQKEGPFTVDQINRDLVSKRIRESDYWAWYEGLPQWMPLHAVPGIISSAIPVPSSAPEPRRAVATPKPAQEQRRPVAERKPDPNIDAIPDVFTKATPSAKPAAQSGTGMFRKANPAAEQNPDSSGDAIPDIFTKATPSSGKKPAQPATDVFRKANPAADRKSESSGDAIPDVFTKATPSSEKKSQRVAQPGTDLFKRTGAGADRNSEQVGGPIGDVFSKVNSSAPTKPASPQPARTPAVSKSESSSGLPFNALEQIFIFTSGEGRNIFQSAAVAEKLQEVTGQALAAIRGIIPVSVVGRVGISVELMLDAEIPERAWRAMFAIKPAMAQKAKDELMQVCVRTFSVETQDSVALILLYSKEKMQLATA
jgi:hypothetical protein